MGKIASDGPKWGQEDLFLLIQTLPTFWAERIWILRICICSCVGSYISGSPGPQISKFQDFQTPPAPAPDELSDPNLTSLPVHPGTEYVARSPCCDIT